MSGQRDSLDVPQGIDTGGTSLAGQDGSVDLPQGTGAGGTILSGQGGTGAGTGGVIPIGQGGTGAGGAMGQGGSTTADAPVDQTRTLPVGTACQISSECALGNCIDGFCCASACAGCNACSNALTGKASGTCAPVLTGQDPHGTCADETASNQCGNDGTCDGAGACRKVSTSHTCTQASCSSDGKTFTPATTCDGKGACTTATAQSCGAFQCAATGCLKTCTAQSDCGAGNYCNTTAGTCAAKKQDGLPATQTYECTSGIVANGVCCNESCGECNSCSTGTCAAVSNGTGCGSGKVCAGGSCQTGCWIGGSLFTSNAVNSSNNCQVCAPTKSTTAWSNNDAYPPSCNIDNRSYCSNGVLTTETCSDGCYDGACRSDGTIGKAGWVSCGVGTGPITTRCLASEGCGSGECNKSWGTHCDGPNDCKAGEKCCGAHDRGGSFESVCTTQECATLNKNTVCDPLVPNYCPAFCRPGLIEGGYWSCQSS